MTFDKSHSAGFLANQMARLFAAGLQRRLRPLGLAPAQFMVLLELWDEDGLTQRDLVTRLDVEQATMANTLRRMERDGLITRHPHSGDKRASVIAVTARATAIRADAVAAATDQNALALARLSDAEQAQFLALMRRVISCMKQDDRA